MERLTTRHNGVAVIKDKSKHKEAMEKLARYEELEERNIQAIATVKINVCVEIKDSCMFGGIGSIGYAEGAMVGDGRMMRTDLQKFVNAVISNYARTCKVPEDNIRVITREEYEANLFDEEEEEE